MQLRPPFTWSHEIGSAMLFEYLVDQNHLDVETEDIRIINNLVRGKSPKQDHEKSKFSLLNIIMLIYRVALFHCCQFQ